jgi:hypothetical protein
MQNNVANTTAFKTAEGRSSAESAQGKQRWHAPAVRSLDVLLTDNDSGKVNVDHATGKDADRHS